MSSREIVRPPTKDETTVKDNKKRIDDLVKHSSYSKSQFSKPYTQQEREEEQKLRVEIANYTKEKDDRKIIDNQNKLIRLLKTKEPLEEHGTTSSTTGLGLGGLTPLEVARKAIDNIKKQKEEDGTTGSKSVLAKRKSNTASKSNKRPQPKYGSREEAKKARKERNSKKGGYRYSELGMKGLTIAFGDDVSSKKVTNKTRKRRRNNKGKKGKKGTRRK